MWQARGRATIHFMSAHLDLTRRVLVPTAGPPPSSQRAPRVGNYRLARVPRYTRPEPAQDRFAHLRRSYD